MLPTIPRYTISFGCDPEFFFSRNGKIIGSEKILPAEGMNYKTTSPDNPNDITCVVGKTRGKITIDGVQAELNPRPNTCRANLGNELSFCFRALYEKIQSNPNVQIDFSQNVKISKAEMDTLDEKSKQFGCSPSFNNYEPSAITIRDASKFYSRSAGGHLHLGCLPASPPELKQAIATPKLLIPFLDLIVGNTCVLIDKNRANANRRKIYGRASEYRPHEDRIEYRTLSNFWLRNYALMSFVTGLARQAVSIAAHSIKYPKLRQIFMSKIKEKNIINAINKNSFRLAKKNFNAIKPSLLAVSQNNDPINSNNINAFELFIKKNIDYWFPEDPVKHWINLPDGHNTGWNEFISTLCHNSQKNK